MVLVLILEKHYKDAMQLYRGHMLYQRFLSKERCQYSLAGVIPVLVPYSFTFIIEKMSGSRATCQCWPHMPGQTMLSHGAKSSKNIQTSLPRSDDGTKTAFMLLGSKASDHIIDNTCDLSVQSIFNYTRHNKPYTFCMYLIVSRYKYIVYLIQLLNSLPFRVLTV